MASAGIGIGGTQHGLPQAAGAVLARIERLESYLADLEKEAAAVKEHIAEIKKSDVTRHLPVVFLTARAGEKHRRMGLELGASAFLNKPFSEPELLQLVSQLTG